MFFIIAFNSIVYECKNVLLFLSCKSPQPNNARNFQKRYQRRLFFYQMNVRKFYI